MAIIRNTASALRRGKVGNETYYVALNKQVVRVAQNDSNYGETASRTISQQGNRVRWANLVQFYKLSKGWMSKAFENKKAGQSDYNRFMQLNLSNARIYFTKEAVAASSVVVDEFTISQGSLRQVNVQQVGNAWATDIQLGSLTIGAATTIADLTTAILNANNWAKEGMQISFISYQQQTDSLGFPVAICTAYELTLSSTDTRLVRSFLPEFCSQTSSRGTLGTNTDISVGGFAYIISQTIGGKTLVSTQKLVVNNTAFISQYSSERMRELAIYSYGLNEASFLDSGSLPVTKASQPQYIQYLVVEGEEDPFLPNQNAPDRSRFSQKSLTFKFAYPLAEDATIVSIVAKYPVGESGAFYTPAVSTDRLSVTAVAPALPAGQSLESFEIITTAGTFVLRFNTDVEIYE